jgi:hypothetical protein
MKTPFETSSPGPASLDRVQLTLAAPLLVLLASSFVTWIWRALGLPGTTGGVSPLAALLILAVVFGGIYATQRRLPISLFTWFPAGLAGIVLLGEMLATKVDTGTSLYTGFAIFPIVFVFVLMVCIAISKSGAQYGVAFAAIMLMAQQAPNFALFAFDSGGPVTAATLLTFVAAALAVLEIGLLLVLINRLLLDSTSSINRTSIALVALVLLHGPLTGWEQLLRSDGELTFRAYLGWASTWILLAGFAMSAVTIFSRLRRSWFLESTRTAEARAAQPPKEVQVVDVTTAEPFSPEEDAPAVVGDIVDATEALPEPSESRPDARPDTPRKRPDTFRRRRR